MVTPLMKPWNGELDRMEQEVKILAIESSCDETAAAVVVNGRKVLSARRAKGRHKISA